MPLVLAGATSGQATVQATDAATVTLTLPATTGTLVVTGGAQTIEFADGSAAAPSITNSGDTNTGIFFPAADTIAFTEGGVESMRIDASGNVGIGVTPSAWFAGANVLQIGKASGIYSNTGVNQVKLLNNVRFDASGNPLYLSTGTAQDYTLDNSGNFIWSSAISGSAGGAVTLNERMRIQSNGFIGIGTTSSNYPLQVSYSSNTGPGVGILDTTPQNGNTFIQFRNNATTCGTITSDGSSSTSYNTSSDYRLKEDIAPMTGALDKVSALKPVTYKWKATGKESQGFIAHELAEVVPECVTGEKDGMRTEQYEVSPAIPATYDEEGNELTPAVEAVMGEREVPDYQGVDTSFLVATLTAAIQEQQAIITDLKARIETLENT